MSDPTRALRGAVDLSSLGGAARPGQPPTSAGAGQPAAAPSSAAPRQSAGQAADAGIIEFAQGGVTGRLEVLDVQRPVRGLVVHQVRAVDEEFLPTGDLQARVEEGAGLALVAEEAILHADLAPVMADPVGTLANRAERVAATWSPRR